MRRVGAARAALLTVLVLMLAGCSTRTTESTDPFLSRTGHGVDTVDGRVGQLRLLNVAIAAPGTRGSVHIAGSSAALLLTVANDGKATDQLTGAGFDAAQRVVFRDGDEAAKRHIRVAVPAGGTAVLREVSGPHLELSGLREILHSGFTVPVTFDFRDAGSVTLDVPVRPYSDVRPDKYAVP